MNGETGTGDRLGLDWFQPDSLDSFVRHLTRETGSNLRAVVRYSRTDGIKPIFLRTDLYSEPDILEADLQELTQELLVTETITGSERPRSTIKVFESIVLFHISVDASAGYVVTLESYAARDLNEFITDCRQALQETTDDQRQSVMADGG